MQLKKLTACLIVTLAVGTAWGGTEKALVNFDLFPRGSNYDIYLSFPNAPLVADGAGNFYGTTGSGGTYGYGTVFKISPNSHGGWTQDVLYSFTGAADGGHPSAGLTLDPKGNLYGVTSAGGGLCIYGLTACGVVFRLTPNSRGGWTESVLHTFGGTDGAIPLSSLTWDSAGNLYGTTEFGGDLSDGVVFQLVPSSNGTWTENVLYSFSAGSSGAYPNTDVIFDSAGNLYGSTPTYEDSNGDFFPGVIFELSPASGGWSQTILYTGTGANAPGLVSDKAGNLYGANSQYVFELKPSPGGWTQFELYRFQGGVDGFYVAAGVVLDGQGNLYGATSDGGTGRACSSGCGTVFELNPSTNGVWTKRLLYSFQGNDDGASPSAGLIRDRAGNLYGTTARGGVANVGTIFQLSRAAGARWKKTSMFQFPGGHGATPSAGLTMDAAGSLYGTTKSGGTHGFGSVFELKRSATGRWIETLLYSFTGGMDGGQPAASMIFDSLGNLYGVTEIGGNLDCGLFGPGGGCGAVFKLSSSASGLWTETVLRNFQGSPSDGAFPTGKLMFDQAGNLYGTTQYGGPSGCGTVFELSPASSGWTETVIYSFKGHPLDGELPQAGLIMDAAGNLYGTAAGGGSYGSGAVFELSPSASETWTETLLHTFTGGSDGGTPSASLIFDATGNLYSTTKVGGDTGPLCSNYGCGVVFELSPSSGGMWTETVLHQFDYNGHNPVTDVVFDQGGNLYGTTTSIFQGGGTTDFGNVFRLSQQSGGGWKNTVLYTFTGGSDGGYPLGGVVLDGSGKIYGTASIGGVSNQGVVFEVRR